MQTALLLITCFGTGILTVALIIDAIVNVIGLVKRNKSDSENDEKTDDE
jgi:hypothetical protein